MPLAPISPPPPRWRQPLLDANCALQGLDGVFASCSVLFCLWVHGPLVLPLAPLRSYFHVFFPASLPTYYPIFHPMSLPSTTLFLLHPSLPGRLISSPTTFTQRWEEGAHLLPPNVLPTYLFPGVSSLNNFFMHTP